MDSIKDGVQQVVQELYDTHGRIETQSLVDAARPVDSPAHAGFEWDDSAAGEQYRLMQARRWIRVVEITYKSEPQRLIHVPQTIVVQKPHYQVSAIIASDDDLYEAALKEAIDTLRAAKRAVADLQRAAKKAGRPTTALNKAANNIDQAQKVVENSRKKPEPKGKRKLQPVS